LKEGNHLHFRFFRSWVELPWEEVRNKKYWHFFTICIFLFLYCEATNRTSFSLPTLE
jgi:hypothetical protein